MGVNTEAATDKGTEKGNSSRAGPVVQLVRKGHWTIRKDLQNQVKCKEVPAGRFYCTFLLLWRSPQCFLRDTMGVGVERSLGVSSGCTSVEMQQWERRAQSTPTAREGAGGHYGLVALIPCRRRLLQDAAPYRESNTSCRHSNDNIVIKNLCDCSFPRIGKPLGHCLRSAPVTAKESWSSCACHFHEQRFGIWELGEVFPWKTWMLFLGHCR